MLATMNPIQQTYTQSVSGTSQRAEVAPQQVAPQQVAAQQAAAQRAGAAPAAPSAGAAAGETVSISESARQLLASAAAQPGTTASPQRLQALRQAIASGSYAVDARGIARGLLRDSRALAGAGGGAGSGA